MYKSAVIVVLASMAALCIAQNADSPYDFSYQFPMDYDLLLDQPVNPVFSCQGRPYGYYADAANNCQIFHVCWPIEDDFGAIIDTAAWSFVCGNQTIFDQQTLTCNYPEDSLPCDQAESFYGLVEFGKIDGQF